LKKLLKSSIRNQAVRKFIIAILSSAMIMALGSACGVKAPPQPGRYLLPTSVSALKYYFNEDGLLVISFKAPLKNQLGKPLSKFGGFFLDRRIRFKAKKMEKSSDIWAGTYTYKDRLSPGHVYHYRIFAHDHKGRYDNTKSQNLVIYYDSPSRPPDAINFKTDDRQVTLTWPPPDRLIDGRQLRDLAGYNIYRRTGMDSWEKINADQPWNRTVFEDRQVQNGQTYFYKVSALRRWHGTWIEGSSTPVISAVPVDLTPPPPPVKLEGASIKAGISLRALILEPVFLDQTVKSGRLYYYRVTSVDKSEAANESELGRELSISHKY